MHQLLFLNIPDDKGVMNLSSASTIGDNTFIELNALDGAIWENGNMIKIFRVIAAFKEAHPELEVAPLTTTDIIINTTKITNTKTEKIIKGIWLHHSPQR